MNEIADVIYDCDVNYSNAVDELFNGCLCI